jgi:hypothetical protein
MTVRRTETILRASPLTAPFQGCQTPVVVSKHLPGNASMDWTSQGFDSPHVPAGVGGIVRIVGREDDRVAQDSAQERSELFTSMLDHLRGDVVERGTAAKAIQEDAPGGSR